VSAVPTRLLDALREVLIEHADDLGIDPASITRRPSHAVTTRTTEGGLLRLDASAYSRAELTR
jgi:hypothetical protein